MPPTDRPAVDDFLLHAWVDESMRMPRPGQTGAYFLAAAVADPSACEPVRDGLRQLVLRGTDRLHWRHESSPRQAKIASAIAEHDLVHLVVVGMPLDARKQERARRHCMERLLYELQAVGVSQVWFETRTASLNARDASMVEALRGSRGITSRLRVDFADPADDPMLWVPDAVAGISSLHARGSAPDLHELIAPMLETVEISLA